MVHVLDLFCGMGGLSLGFLLGIRDSEATGYDIDKYAVATYNRNLNRLGGRAFRADLLSFTPPEKPKIIVAGVPCQPFSFATKPDRKGEKHPLFPTFARFWQLVKEKEPDAFVMENVKGLVSSRFRPLLMKYLGEVGDAYRVTWKVLNAAHYGVPQRRERLFVVGIKRDLGAKFEFPRETHGPEERILLDGARVCRWLTVREAIGDLLAIPPRVRLAHRRSQKERAGPSQADPLPRHMAYTADEPARTVASHPHSPVLDHETTPLTREQLRRIRAEREDTTRHLAKMKFPDDLDEPCRTVSSHTVEGSKRETIVIPAEHLETFAAKKLFPAPRGKPVDLDKPARTVKVDGRGGDFCNDTMLVPADHEMTPKGGWATGKSDWGSRVMDLEKPAYTITEKHRSGQLINWGFSDEILRKHPPQRLDQPSGTVRANFWKTPPDACVLIPPTTEEAMGRPSPTVVADARIYATGRRERGSDASKGCLRRLTVRECLRLQSFPDWWAFPPEISTSRKYKLTGEAVPPVLAYRLAVALAKALGLETREPPKPEEWALPYFRRAFADYFG